MTKRCHSYLRLCQMENEDGAVTLSLNLRDSNESVNDLNTTEYAEEAVNIETLVGKRLLTRDGKEVQVGYHFETKKIIIYFFSASWVPAAELVGRLKTLHLENLKRNTKMEIVFVSSDTDEEAFREYFAEQGPWCAIPFKSAICDELRWMYGITCLPQVIVIRTDGTVITRKGKDELETLGNNVIVSWSDFVQK